LYVALSDGGLTLSLLPFELGVLQGICLAPREILPLSKLNVLSPILLLVLSAGIVLQRKFNELPSLLKLSPL